MKTKSPLSLLALLLLSACQTVTTTTKTTTDGKKVETVTARTVDGASLASIGQLVLSAFAGKGAAQ